MPQFKTLPPLARVKELVRYDASTGKLFWLQSVARWIKPGDEAGTKVKHAIDITLDKTTYRAHRIIWLLMTGQDPGGAIIDHIDGNPHNNKFTNLRLATHHQNQCNQKVRSDNTSGFKGVTWDQNRKKWSSSIHAKGKRIFLGRFNTKEEAYRVYCEAAKELHKEFSRLH